MGKLLVSGATTTMWVVDHGVGEGVDISFRDPVNGGLRFELIVLDPDACMLLDGTSRADAALSFLMLVLQRSARVNRICLVLQFQQRLDSDEREELSREDRESRIMRMVEDIADEVFTREPTLIVDVAMRTDTGKILSLM